MWHWSCPPCLHDFLRAQLAESGARPLRQPAEERAEPAARERPAVTDRHGGLLDDGQALARAILDLETVQLIELPFNLLCDDINILKILRIAISSIESKSSGSSSLSPPCNPQEYNLGDVTTITTNNNNATSSGSKRPPAG